MFVRKTILLDKHNSVLGNSTQLKKKDDKIFLTSAATNKYPVRYNSPNINIGHFNYITETPSAYVYDLNEDINEGFVKHDYSELHDQDLLENVEDVELMPDTGTKDFNILDYDNNNSRWRYAYYSSDQSKVRDLNVKGDWVIKNLNTSVMLTNTVTGESFSKSLPYNANFGACIFLYGDTDTHCIFAPIQIPYRVDGAAYSNIASQNFQKFIEFDKINKTFTLYRDLYLGVVNTHYHNVQRVVSYPDINSSIYVPTQRLFAVCVQYHINAGIESNPSNHPGDSYFFKLSETFTAPHYDSDLQYLSIGSIVYGQDGTASTKNLGNMNRSIHYPAGLYSPNSGRTIPSISTMMTSSYYIVESQLLSIHLVMNNIEGYYIRIFSTDLELIQDGEKIIDLSDSPPIPRTRATYVLAKQKTIKLPLIETLSFFNFNDSGDNIHYNIQSNSKMIMVDISKNVFNSTVRVRPNWGGTLANDKYLDKLYGPSYTADDPESYALEGQDYTIQVRNLAGLDANSKRYSLDGIGLAKIEYRRFDTPLIDTNKSFKSLRTQYVNPLLNRTFEDELFDSNLANTNHGFHSINLPKGVIGIQAEYNYLRWWSYIQQFRIYPGGYGSYELSEFRVYGDSSVVDTLAGKYNTESQTLFMHSYTAPSSGATPLSKNTSASFELIKEPYIDSKVFNIKGKEIDLTSIVNMSKCTFIPQHIKEATYCHFIFAFDFWSVESSVNPPSTMYFEMDLKVYKNVRYALDYEAEYDIITLKAITFKPSGRYFAFSVSTNFKELFVEQYPGAFTYNIYPGFWYANSHPTPALITANSSSPTGLLVGSTDRYVAHYLTNNYSQINKKALKNPDEYVTLIKATEQSKEYEIVYINIIPVDDFTAQIKFKVKLNKGLKFKTKVAIIVNPNDLFIEFNDSKYSQLSFNIEDLSVFEFKISSKQLPINNEMISNISYKIQDVDSSIQYINIKDI